MKLQITHQGAHGPDGELPVGAVLDLPTIPGWLVGKCREVEPERVAVTNPAQGAVVQPSAQERQAVLLNAALLLDDDAFNASGLPDVRAINRIVGDDEPFTAGERDALWPGIAASVDAARA